MIRGTICIHIIYETNYSPRPFVLLLLVFNSKTGNDSSCKEFLAANFENLIKITLYVCLSNYICYMSE